MRKIFRPVYALLVGVLCYSCDDKADFSSVDVSEFAKVIKDTTVVLLDVRTTEEHEAGCIEGTSLQIDVLKDDFEQLAMSHIEEGSTVALYCRSGNRSKRAASLLAVKGYRVIELDTGYNGWVEAAQR